MNLDSNKIMKKYDPLRQRPVPKSRRLPRSQKFPLTLQSTTAQEPMTAQERIDTLGALNALSDEATRLQTAVNKLKTSVQDAKAQREVTSKTCMVFENSAKEFETAAIKLRQTGKDLKLKVRYTWGFMVKPPAKEGQRVVPEQHETIDDAKKFLDTVSKDITPVQRVDLIIIPALEDIDKDMKILKATAEADAQATQAAKAKATAADAAKAKAAAADAARAARAVEVAKAAARAGAIAAAEAAKAKAAKAKASR